ncbi:MAG: hypothetical protein LBK40_00560, partial [Spirochaetaceae bacterium]|nr:hypothetical protein [Spirochaetaceae bacterium]
MAKKFFFINSSVLLVVVFIAFISCDNGTNGGNSFQWGEGTWISTTTTLMYGGNFYRKAVNANGNSKCYIATSQTETPWTEVLRSTYPYPANASSAITLTITEVNTTMFDGIDNWETWEDLNPTNQGRLGGSQTTTVSMISNTQMTAFGVTFE